MSWLRNSSVMTQRPIPKAVPGQKSLSNRRRRHRGQVVVGLLFCLPLTALFAVFVYYPLVKGFQMSLQSLDYSLGASGAFVGLANYRDVLQDPDTQAAFLHTLAYTGFAVTIEILGGMCLALALNRPFRGRGLVLALMVLPWALPGVVSGILWSRIFATNNGLLNSVLMRLHVIDTNQVWFNHEPAGIFLISCVHAWGVLPLTTLIILAGLQGIPAEMYQAAQVDGASWWRQFTALTLPLMRPSIAVALTVGTTTALAIFDEIYVLNGKALATRSVTSQIYQTTFVNLDFGQGTALAYVLTVATAVFGIAYVKGLRRAT